ncbi:LacI family DNA-binding transcriptional regulator [Evansella cellulosilytica]|uniref:Transcriptional regulator, LacI family n=1 Tax=Evansella cellulosilytica (strain ATCC 21833 / DSM 2522 / FERM P-1141 / JCM 9156 / N-4) TaxID=649639 RepID=E6TTG8_EVAC2|nr:LacI family DNA-binding transcriptional regulator [Evansella cellulosilytica]ADU29604.1 transcriptional regulator, LacI family [Evansella cellulosilytica DSM 2522]
MKVTMGDVARKAGVSKTTVSRILNGNYSHTTYETRKRVIKAIEELDYRPNALAKGLKSAKTNVIGMVLSNLKNPFWATVLEGVEDACHNKGYNLMICNTNEEKEKEEEYIKAFQTKQVDGIVINPTGQNLPLYKSTVSSIPTVVINRRIPDLSAHTVIADNEKGAYLAVRHLLKNSRKNIAAIAFQNPYVSTWKDRLKGYQNALYEKGFLEEAITILELEQKSDSVRESIIRFIKNNANIDAIFSTNNMITLEIIGAINELGLAIPEDIAIIGYDETIWSKYLNPPLTTIRQPGYLMGRIAVENLISAIDEKRKLENYITMLVPELIIRESCGTKTGL